MLSSSQKIMQMFDLGQLFSLIMHKINDVYDWATDVSSIRFFVNT